MKPAWIVAALLLACLGFSTGCAGEEDATPSSDIGPKGGAFSDRGVTLRIPPGALSETVRLSVHEVTPPDLEGLETVGGFFRLEPSHVAFADPVMVEVRFDAADLPEGRSPDQVQLVTAAEFSFPFTALETAYDASRGILTTSLEILGILGPVIESP